MTSIEAPRDELRFDGPCHECGGAGPIVIVQCDTDPGDMGEPRIVHADDETIVFVPSFDLWPSLGEQERRELAASFWVHYRCGFVGCVTVEPHEHGGGQPVQEVRR